MKRVFGYLGRNWVTTAGGALTILSGIPAVTNVIAPLVQPILDNPPRTKTDWLQVGIGALLVVARDPRFKGPALRP